MYSEEDINDAVEAGVLKPQAAEAFRAYVAARSDTPTADRENFRLITGFNDIFVVVAGVLAMWALYQLIQGVLDSDLVPGLSLVAASWLLAEYFTRIRRMALPSIVFLLTFLLGAFFVGLALAAPVAGESARYTLFGEANTLLPATLLMVLAAYAHWRRFRVPITVAAGAGALLALVLATLHQFIPDWSLTGFQSMLLVGGLLIFVQALRWDLSDPKRLSRNSDIAFWLHLLAAPLIMHSVVYLLNEPVAAWGVPSEWPVIGVYLLAGAVALLINRRVFLVSGMLYLALSVSGLLEQFGVMDFAVELAAFLIGGLLLLLSVFWSQVRELFIALFPAHWRERLPD